MFTHFQILVEEAELSEALQVVVLLPAAVQTLWVVSCLPAAPPVHHPSEGHKGAMKSFQGNTIHPITNMLEAVVKYK